MKRCGDRLVNTGRMMVADVTQVRTLMRSRSSRRRREAFGWLHTWGKLAESDQDWSSDGRAGRGS